MKCSWGLVLVLLAACASEKEVTVTVPLTSVVESQDPASNGVKALPLGSRIKVKVPRFGSAKMYALTEGPKMWVPADDVAPYPIAGTLMYVAANDTPMTKSPKEQKDVVKLPIGQPVTVAKWPAIEALKMLAVLEDGAPKGFVFENAVNDKQPSAQAFAGFVRDALKKLAQNTALADALSICKAGLKAYPSDASLTKMAGLIEKATTDPEAYTYPAAKLLVDTDSPVKKPGKAFVASAWAPLLAGKKDDAKVVTYVRQNQPIDVLEIAGEWAKVTPSESEEPIWRVTVAQLDALPPKLPEKFRAPESDDDDAKPTEAPALYVRLGHLQGVRSVASKLAERGKRWLTDKKTDAGIEMMARAVASAAGDFPDLNEVQALADAAADANDIERVLWVHQLLSGDGVTMTLPPVQTWSTPVIVEAALLAGCRDATTAQTKTISVAEGATLKRPKSGDCLIVTDLDPVCADCNQDEAEAKRDQSRLQSATDKFWEVADELYPQGPFLRVTVANQSFNAGPPAEPLFIHYDNKSYWVPVKSLGAYEHVAIYISLRGYKGEVYGVALGSEQPSAPSATGSYVENNPAGTSWLGQDLGECEDCYERWHPPEENGD